MKDFFTDFRAASQGVLNKVGKEAALKYVGKNSKNMHFEFPDRFIAIDFLKKYLQKEILLSAILSNTFFYKTFKNYALSQQLSKLCHKLVKMTHRRFDRFRRAHIDAGQLKHINRIFA